MGARSCASRNCSLSIVAFIIIGTSGAGDALEIVLVVTALEMMIGDSGDNGHGDGDNDDGDPFAVVHVVWQPFRTAHSYHVGKIAQDSHIIVID